MYNFQSLQPVICANDETHPLRTESECFTCEVRSDDCHYQVVLQPHEIISEAHHIGKYCMGALPHSIGTCDMRVEQQWEAATEIPQQNYQSQCILHSIVDTIELPSEPSANTQVEQQGPRKFMFPGGKVQSNSIKLDLQNKLVL